MKKLSNLSLQEIILRNVVIHYIDTPEPIGSKQLKSSLEVDVSPATIRNYFKKLVEQGYLDQLHSSSGRIPTSMAFKQFWNEQINVRDLLEIDSFSSLENGSKFFGVYSLFRKEENNRIANIYNIEGKYLLIVFEKGEIIIKDSKLISAFLAQFEGYDVKDIYRIARGNGIDELASKLSRIIDKGVGRYNQRELLSVAHSSEAWGDAHFESYFNGSVLDTMENGIYFEHFAPKDHMVIKRNCMVDGIYGSLVVLGHMSRDFNNFYRSI